MEWSDVRRSVLAETGETLTGRRWCSSATAMERSSILEMRGATIVSALLGDQVVVPQA